MHRESDSPSDTERRRGKERARKGREKERECGGDLSLATLNSRKSRKIKLKKPSTVRNRFVVSRQGKEKKKTPTICCSIHTYIYFSVS